MLRWLKLDHPAIGIFHGLHWLVYFLIGVFALTAIGISVDLLNMPWAAFLMIVIVTTIALVLGSSFVWCDILFRELKSKRA